ncbi:MAG: nucleotidyltransferase family protein [Herminiimonas sp.]|uniref:nucleotidyltransferase family protein n=1 Tax=Herminiimonas sp. TaxID=1926289 RepID=UPI00271FFD20|nr:nucleotidyltransferase family protein [Herminiimonas sp.]MDO9421042.1 nucleotidyltransferase family protein [Herminiimonas sp.]
MTAKPVVIVLAAGKGERFHASGGKTHKLAASLAGATVLERVLRAVELAGLDLHVVKHSPGSGGMADSIAAGVSATPHAAGWLILPGDLPMIQAKSLQLVANGLLLQKVVVPHYRQQQGHPVAFRHECFEALCGLSGDAGAKTVVEKYRASHEVFDLVLDDAGLVTDIDTVDDLAKAEELFVRTDHPA